jgi:Ice-binding-like/Bacterial Ig-like domain
MKAAALLLVLIGACTFSTAGLGGGGADGGSEPDGGRAQDGGRSVDGGSTTTPTVLSVSPVNGASGISLNGSVRATFSETMDPATFTTSTFRLTSGPSAAAVPGVVSYVGGVAVFWSNVHLTSNSVFIATITTGAESASGIALGAAHTWSFATGNPYARPVTLGSAGDYVVLAKGAISGTTAAVKGKLGVSPAAATYITGFSLVADASNVFSTSAQINGKVYAADYAPPTPANLTAAVSDMELAFTEAAARTPDVSELGVGNLGGMTLVPGVYRWSTGVHIPSNLTLTGNATGVWIFQIAQDFTIAAGTSIVLTGGALPQNVFWQISGGPVTLGAAAHLEGVVLTSTAVTLGAGASVKGRILAQTAVTIDGSTVAEPVP